MLKKTNVLISGPAGNLEVLLHTPLKTPLERVAVICHPHPLFGGTLHNKVVSTLAKAFETQGMATLRFNFRGVGQSAGHYDAGQGEQEDLLAILQWLKTNYAHTKIWLGGFSFGSYIAFAVAQKWPVEQVFLVAPPVQHFHYATSDTWKVPTLLIQGEADDIVSPHKVFEWVKKQHFPLTVIRFPGVGHFFHGHLVQLRQCIEQYVTEPRDQVAG